MYSKMKKVIALTSALMLLNASALAQAPSVPPENTAIEAAPWAKSEVYGENLIEKNIPAADGSCLSLNGEWGFSLYKNPAEAEKKLFEKAEDKIRVPSAWQLAGFDIPRYSVERCPWVQGNAEYPSVTAEDNPTGVYSRSFTVPKNMKGRRLYLCIDRGGSALYVYLNGKYAGYGEGGFLQKSFDITELAADGENELVIEVIRYSDSSYTENRDGFNLSGLFGDVSLRASDMAETYFSTEYDEKNGIINIEALDGSASIDIDGKTVELHSGKNIVDGVKPWSPENPVLYTMKVIKGDETAKYEVGFRTFAEADGRFMLNGAEYELKPLRYSAFNPRGGYYADAEALRRDIELMKSIGVNMIVTDDITLPSEFYALTDKLGMLVADCSIAPASRIDLQRYADAAASYARRMLLRDKNYCSVAVWGTGIECEAAKKVLAGDGRMVVSDNGRGSLSAEVCFADEALYAVKENYDFEIENKADGVWYRGSGEVKNYMGKRVLGGGEIAAEPELKGSFTVELWLYAEEDAELRAGNVFVRAGGGGAEFAVGEAAVTGSLGRGREGEPRHIAAVCTGNELRLFADDSFKANAAVENTAVETGVLSGGGAIREIRIYDRALKLDELCAEEPIDGLKMHFTFDNIKTVTDRSTEYLGYGGDFGDYPNDGAGVARGIFNAEREPLPEAKALAEKYLGIKPVDGDAAVRKALSPEGEVKLVQNGSRVSVKGEGFEAQFDGGGLASYSFGGKTLISSPTKKSFVTPKPSAESLTANRRMWREYAENAEADSVSAEDFGSYADITARYNFYDLGNYTETCRVYADGTVLVFAEVKGEGFDACANIFELDGEGVISCIGREASTYDGAIYGAREKRTEDTDEKRCPYLVPQEYGNHAETRAASVKLANGGELTFFGADFDFNALPYSFEALERAEHEFELVSDGKTYVRVGSVSVGDDANTAAACYAFKGANGGEPEPTAAYHELIEKIKIGENELKDISPLKTDYAVCCDGGEITAECTFGAEASVEMKDGYCTVTAKRGECEQRVNIYFADKAEFVSDLEPLSVSGGKNGVSVNKTYSGGTITVMGDRWQGEDDILFDKGIAAYGDSEITFDVSEFNNKAVSFTVAKDFPEGGWGGFGNESSFYIYGNGELLASAEHVSLMNGRQTITADLSGVSTLKLVTKGEGGALWCGGQIAAREPKIFASLQSGKYKVVVLNNTAAEIKPLIYSSSYAAEKVSAVSRRVLPGDIEVFYTDNLGEPVVLEKSLNKKVISEEGK